MCWSSKKAYNCSNSVKMTIALLRVLIRTGFSPNWRLRMHHPNLPLGGTCRCATIRFKLLATPIMVVACHCRDCQTLTSNAFSITAMVPTHGFKIIEVEPIKRSLPKSHRHHFFVQAAWLGYLQRLRVSRPASIYAQHFATTPRGSNRSLEP